MLEASAPAKINLTLEVVGKRPDGFHELVSIIQTVSVFDSLAIEPASEITLHTENLDLQNATNLAVRAAECLLARAGSQRGCRIALHKHIPVAAGLGGGSSDAAATLVALNQVWDLRLDCNALTEIAAALGSDVPFFLYGGRALVRGRGEQVLPLVPAPQQWYVLVTPPFAVPTAQVFASLQPGDWSDGSATRACVRAGNAPVPVNSLEPALFRAFPEAHEWYMRLNALSPGRVFVSGSGPTLVARCPDEGAAHRLHSAVQRWPCWTMVATDYTLQTRKSPCVSSTL